jgi:hypothetical protein
MEVGDRECALMRALRVQTCMQHLIFSIGSQTTGSIGPKIGTNTHWKNGQKVWGRRSRVRIDARSALANVRAAPHIQLKRPNGWTDRAPHWYKHTLGQWAGVMGVGDRVCTLRRVQTCVQHHIFSIGSQTTGSIGPTIGTNTHWDNGQKRVCINALAARAYERTTPHIQHKRPNDFTDQATHWYIHSLGQLAEVMGVEHGGTALASASKAKQNIHTKVA